MSFGGAASAMNVAIKQNAALRGKDSFRGRDMVKWSSGNPQAGLDDSASMATKKRLREKYLAEAAIDRKREFTAYLIGLLISACLLYLIW